MKVSTTDIGLLLIRIAVGAVLVAHGSQKLFGAFGGPGLEGFAGYLSSMHVIMPYPSAVAAALAEFFGGLALLLGIFVHLAAIPVAITMAVACWAHWPVFLDSQQSGPGYEFAMVLGLTAAGLGLIGPGGLSLSALMNKQSTTA